MMDFIRKNLIALVIRCCLTPAREFGLATVLSLLPALAFYFGKDQTLKVFASGWLFGIATYTVLLAWGLALPLGYTKTKFTLSTGLASRIARLHLPRLEPRELKPKELISDLVMTLGHLDAVGFNAIELNSVLLGDSSLRQRLARQLSSALENQGVAWRLVDQGTHQNVFGDVIYWLHFVGGPSLLKRLVPSYEGASIDLRRFKEPNARWMTWGSLLLQKQ